MATITVNRGTTYTMEYEHIKNGEAATLVGATIRFTVKEDKFDDSADDSTAIVKKDVTVHTDGAAGLSEIVLDPVDTSDAEPGKYWYDIVVEEADGSIYRMAKDRFVLSGGPTNRS